MKIANKYSKGLITRCTNYKEADRIFTLLSEEEGLMKFIARGAKKPSSRLSGHIEPLNYVNIFYKPSKSLNSVSQVQSIDSFLEIKNNYNLIIKAQYLMELAETMSSEKEESSFILKLLKGTLSGIHKSNLPDLDILIFEFEILKTQGFGIRLFECVNCDQKLIKAEHYFSTNIGGFYCQKCFVTNHHQGDMIKTSIEQQSLLRTISRKNYKGLINYNLNIKQIKASRKLIQKSIRDIIGVQLKTIKLDDI